MSSLVDRVREVRTLLFAPGNRPERFAKAAGSGTGLVVFDLEDAVPPEQKAAARAHVSDWLAGGHVCVVRINAAGTEWFDEDIQAVAGHDCVVLVPKAEDPAALRDLAGRLAPASCLIALIETAAGVMNAASIAAVPGVQRLAFGNFDLAVQLGLAPDDRLALASARCALVLASAATGIAPPIDGVTADVHDTDLLGEDVRYARRMGFTGKLCIHPGQLAVADDALRLTGDELRWARSAVEAPLVNGVAVLNGQMVDKPVVDRAHRILRQAEESETSDEA